MSPEVRRVALAALTAVALLFGAATRAVGASWGAPCLLHIDEMGYNFHNAARTEYHRLREGWWRPDLISYGSIPVRAFVVARTLTLGDAIALRESRRAPDAETYLRRAYSFERGVPEAYPWLAVARTMRHLSALLYALAMALAWRVARRLYDAETATVAAWAAAGSVGAVAHAHFFTPEAFLAVGVMALTHAATRIAEHARWRDYAYAALAMVLVVGTKVTSGPVCLLVPLATAMHFRRTKTVWVTLARTLDSGRMWAACVAAGALWLALNPAALRTAGWYFDPATHFSPIEQMRAYQWGARLPDWAIFYVGRGRTYVLREVLADALGRPLEVLALAGAIASLWLERGAKRIPALAAGLVLAPLLMTQLQTIRYTVPALGPLAVCAARAVTLCLGASVARRELWQRWAFGAMAAAGLLAVAHGGVLSVAQTAVYRETDNRVAAARWIAARVRPGDRVILEDHPTYSPPLGNEWGEGVATGARRVPYERLWVGGEDPAAVAAFLRGARFVALNGWNDRLVDVPEARRRHPGQWSFYAVVRARGAPVGFREVARFENGPHVGPWRRDERESEVLSVAFDHVPIRVFERVP